MLMHQRRRRLLRFDNAKSGRLRDTSARKVERTHPYRGVLLLHFHHRARNKLDHFSLSTTILPPLCTTSAPRSRSAFHHHGVNQPFTLRLLFIIYKASNTKPNNNIHADLNKSPRIKSPHFLRLLFNCDPLRKSSLPSFTNLVNNNSSQQLPSEN